MKTFVFAFILLLTASSVAAPKPFGVAMGLRYKPVSDPISEGVADETYRIVPSNPIPEFSEYKLTVMATTKKAFHLEARGQWKSATEYKQVMAKVVSRLTDAYGDPTVSGSSYHWRRGSMIVHFYGAFKTDRHTGGIIYHFAVLSFETPR